MYSGNVICQNERVNAYIRARRYYVLISHLRVCMDRKSLSFNQRLDFIMPHCL